MPLRILTLLIVAGLIGGCGGSGDDDSGNSESPDRTARPLIGTTWLLQEITDADGKVTTPFEGSEPTLNFQEKGTFYSFTGCNRAGGKAVIRGSDQDAEVDFNSVFSTQAACADPLGNEVEGLLMKAFSQQDTIEVPEDGSGMILTAPELEEEGDNPLTFRFVPGSDAS